MMTIPHLTTARRPASWLPAGILRLCIPLLLIMLCTGCQGTVSRGRQPLQNEGALVLYLQPFPQEAQRLDLNMAAIEAVREDGITVPLTLRLSRLSLATVSRQRFLAEGDLPPGSYRGLSFRIAAASIKTEEGTAALLPPEKETVIDFPFSIRARQAVMATLALDYRQAVQEGFRIVPAFSATIPRAPLPTLTGYVTNTGSHTITVFDKKRAEATGVIATGRAPAGIVLDQNQHRAYVALSGDDAIEVIDTATDTSLARIPLTIGDAPRHLALTSDGRTLLSVNSGSNTVSFVDPFSLTETSRLNVGNRPESAILDATGRKAYVFNYLANTLSIVDLGSRTVTSTIATEAGPLRGQLNRKGDQLMVIYGLSPNLLVLDAASLRILRRLPVGTGVSSHKVDSMTDLLYVGMKTDSVVYIYNPYSLLASDSLAAGGSPSHMTIDGELGNLLCVLPTEGRLNLIGLVGKKSTGTVDVGDDPFWVTVNGER
jgi:YVTN family beta-propeller protein